MSPGGGSINHLLIEGGQNVNGRMTITETAKKIGITPKTLTRWEKSGKIRKSKRDWRGWRFYEEIDLAEIKRFYETIYE